MKPLIACILTASWIASPVISGAAITLRDVTIIDGSGRPPLQHGEIRIDGERITGVGPMKHGTSRGVTVIDMHGRTALPGLISDHSHLGMTDGTSAGGKNATRPNVLRQLRQYEVFGVTSVTSLGLNSGVFYELQPQLHSGVLPGADIFGADRGFGAPAGAPPTAMGIGDDQVYRPRSPDEARSQVRETAARRPTLLKIWVDDFHGTLPVKMDPAVYKAVIDEAHANGLRVAAHVFYLDDAKRLVADGVDILAHGVRDQAVDAEFIAALKSRHTWYIPTLGLDEASFLFAEHPDAVDSEPLRSAVQPALAAQFKDPAWREKILGDTHKITADKQALAVNLKNTKTLYDTGVKIGFGTDSGATPLRIAGFAEHRELILLTQAGLSPLQAISVATKSAAELLDLSDRGSIAKGKLADLLIVDGNPSVNILDVDRIVAVWHRGRRVAGSLTSFSP